MRPFFAIMLGVWCCITVSHAQTFIGHLQEKVQGQGIMTVSQSREIDELVNGTNIKVQAEKVTERQENKTVRKDPGQIGNSVQKKTGANNTQPDKESDEFDIPTVDMRKKVMTKSYKVDGYRVQVFAGGNSREDKLKAQQARDKVKMAFPEQPVYVHFYSPRWICRVGNFRNYEEAHQLLLQVQKMGYKQAAIVSGKITVQY